VTDDLGVLRAEFPAYRIWRETARGETRYVAQRQVQVPGPHTVITPDIDELRDMLPSAPAHPCTVAPPGRPAG